MASEHPSDQRTVSEREPVIVPSSTRPKPQSGPPMFNDGLELLRSSHC